MIRPEQIREAIGDHLRRLKSRKETFGVMILRFSSLLPYYQQPKFLSIARRFIDDHFASDQKTAFSLPNWNLVLVYEMSGVTNEKALYFHLRTLMRFDPLMNIETWGEPDGVFMRCFNLTEQRDVAIADIDAVIAEWADMEKSAAGAVALRRRGGGKVSKDSDPLVNPTHQTGMSVLAEQEVLRVSALAERYRSLDIGPLLRREWVIRLDDPYKAVDFAFSMLDPNLLKLMTYRDKRLDSDSAPLNRYLGHIVLYRLLDYVVKSDEKKLHQDVVIPLHPDMVLGEKFQKFKEKLSREQSNRIILQFDLADIFNDFRLFSFITQHLHHSGFRLALGRVTHEFLKVIDLQAMDIDFLFLDSEESWLKFTHAARHALKEQFLAIGSERIILCGIKNPRLIKFGLECGVGLFNGDAASELLREERGSVDFQDTKGADSLMSRESMLQRSRS